MKITAAFATSLTAATGSAVLLSQNTAALYIALGFIASVLVTEMLLIVLYVCRPADRKDLLKLYRVWLGR